MTQKYNDPAGGSNSTIGAQVNHQWWDKQSLIELAKEQYFTQLSSSIDMPKHYGKKLIKFHYLPVLDDRNVNDQGIDAAGATYANGNIYGSSKDVGTIVGKLPLLGEEGGRLNRIGYTRITVEAELNKMGIFDEYTEDSHQFDSDEELEKHQRDELVKAAGELSEDALQIDLLNAAGVIRYCGEATSNATTTGEGVQSEVDYDDFLRLSMDLDNNRCPKQTTVIKGSLLTDTVTVAGARVMYCGTEMMPTLKTMADSFGERAFIPVHKYAAAGSVVRGEVGVIDQFRLVVVPEMMHWAGAGATATGANEGYKVTGGKYDIYPLLCVGDESFATVGFQTDGQSTKFRVIRKAPGAENATQTDPFGEKGFNSIKWFYATLIMRPERIALIKSVARN